MLTNIQLEYIYFIFGVNDESKRTPIVVILYFEIHNSFVQTYIMQCKMK